MQKGSVGRAARAIAHNRPLLRLEYAYGLWAIYEMGIWLVLVLWGYSQGGASFAGIVAIAQYLPAAVLAPVGGYLADRFRRDTALRVGYFVQFLASALLAVLLAVDAGHGPILAFAVITSVLVSWTRPPHYAATAELAQSPGEAAAATSLAGTVERVGYFLGPALVGLASAATSPPLTAAGCAALVLVSGLLLIGVRLGQPSHQVASNASPTRRVRLLPALARRPAVGVVLLVVGVVFLAEGCLELLAVSFANKELAAGAGASGLLIGAEGLGGIVGALLTVALIRWRRLTPVVAGSLAAAALPLLLFSYVTTLPLALTLLVLVGIGMGFFLVAGITLLQRSVPGGVMARILSLRESALLIGLAVGAGFSRFLIREFGATGAYVSLGVVLVAVAFIAVPAGWRLDAVAVFRPNVVTLLGQIEFLGVLDVPSLERLAAGATEMTVPADTVVIRQGDVGDAFYLVESGKLAVTVDGQARSVVLEPGTGFGEIALLRNVERTATVRATSECTLWRIDQELFLETVTGSMSTDLAERHIDMQLDRLGPGSAAAS